MPWTTTRDIGDFHTATSAFLEQHPIDNTVLLTEAAYLTARPSTAPDQLYGWHHTGGTLDGAFLQAPAHPPILTLMPDHAAATLADTLPHTRALGVDARLAPAITRTWPLHPKTRITLHRLTTPPPPPTVDGTPRTATHHDRPLLLDWYHQLMAAHPDDPSEAAYVIDDPLDHGGITLWEIDGTPVAMAGRSRTIAGMTRLSAVHAPHDPAHGQAALIAAIHQARRLAEHVLIFSTAGDHTYTALGFQPVLDRIMLTGRQD